MAFDPHNEDDQARAITKLVDDSLSATERPAIEAWARERDGIARQVAAQRQVAAALRTGGPEAPERLVAAVQARARKPRGHRLRSMPMWRPAIAFAAVAAVCAVVVVVASGGGSTPSIDAAAKLAFAPTTGVAPAAKSATLLDVSYGGVTYPNYAKFSVAATGTRTDRIGGRPALTVFYRLPNGARLSYTVFSGPPVPLPHAAKMVVFEGVPLRTYSTPSGLAVVTLVRFGRTCVLAAPTQRDVVLGLAAAPVLAQAA